MLTRRGAALSLFHARKPPRRTPGCTLHVAPRASRSTRKKSRRARTVLSIADIHRAEREICLLGSGSANSWFPKHCFIDNLPSCHPILMTFENNYQDSFLSRSGSFVIFGIFRGNQNYIRNNWSIYLEYYALNVINDYWK